MSDLDKYARYAKRIPLFNGLRPEEVSDILHKGHALKLLKGKTIFHKGQLGRTIFIVFDGNVNIYDGDHRVARCRVGDAFGMMSVLDHRPHSATAVAATDVQLFTLDEDQINEILDKQTAVRFLLNIIHVLCGHLVGNNSLVTKLERKVEALESDSENN